MRTRLGYSICLAIQTLKGQQSRTGDGVLDRAPERPSVSVFCASNKMSRRSARPMDLTVSGFFPIVGNEPEYAAQHWLLGPEIHTRRQPDRSLLRLSLGATKWSASSSTRLPRPPCHFQRALLSSMVSRQIGTGRCHRLGAGSIDLVHLDLEDFLCPSSAAR